MKNDWVKTAWDVAVASRLTSRWEFWVFVVVAFVLAVLLKRLGPAGLAWAKSAALAWHSLPQKPDLIERPPSDPIPVPKDGIPQPGPQKPDPWNSP